MSPTPSSPHPGQPPTRAAEPASETPSHQQPRHKDDLAQLRTTGKVAVVVTVACYVYGDLTVLRHMEPDPRQDTWLLMKSPLPAVVLCLLYVATVTWWGPLFMRHREPIKGLRPIMMVYNACQVVFSAYIFWETGMGGWFGSYTLLCQRCDYSNNPMAIRMLHAGYWYLFSKFVDFIDTFFFVMNKKNQHVSMLHVCHHALMPVCMWYGIRHHAGGHTTLGLLLNAFVHAVMYLYYLLAAMGPKVRPYLWWKKYLTTLQLLQFSAIIIQNFMVLFVECAVPPVLLVWVSSVAFFLFFLFTDFYIKEYRRRGKHHQTSVSEHERLRELRVKGRSAPITSPSPPSSSSSSSSSLSSSFDLFPAATDLRHQLVSVRNRTAH